MFISKIAIKGFRNFPNNEIEFNDGINVIIGQNNAGKTSLLKAIGLIINNEASRRLEIDDFSKNSTLAEIKAYPPIVTIQLIIKQSENEDAQSDDLVTVSNWLTSLHSPYEAKLTYIFSLPQDKMLEYQQSLSQVSEKDQAWLTIKHEFLRFYSYRIFGGDPSLQATADSDSLQKFDFQFLNAIRDVERDLFTGRNTMLREVFDFFIDYDIKSADVSLKSKVQKQQEIKALRLSFSAQAGQLLDVLHTRMHAGKQEILAYAKQTGATFNNAKPDFDGTISDVDLYSALKLIIGYDVLDIKIPATHNGLGYNNLIFMSLLLAKMQVNADGNYLGGNAKVFPVLAIEEPEAHLHPAMQYKFLRFLKENKDSRKVRQVFVTTHSTQITSAVSLDEIICLHNENGVIHVAYPGKTFPSTPEGQNAKAYVQRYLDATRSDMLFAQKVVFVEGMAEELLLPTLSRYCGKNLEDYHIAIIPVGGRYFDNFLFMFDSNQPYTLPKKVACLKDRDPERKKITGGRSFNSCYPYSYNQDIATYEYKEHISGKITAYATHPNIRFFGQNHPKGKTFEYELCLENVDSNILITDSVKNRPELLELLQLYKDQQPLDELLDELRSSDENRSIETAMMDLTDPSWSENDKKKAIIASRYLASVGKGENALELANLLEDNLTLPLPSMVQDPTAVQIAATPDVTIAPVAQPSSSSPTTTGAAHTLPASIPPNATAPQTLRERVLFNVPLYIQESITWICQ
jgi:putative ATP-dependent endonuclease of OLD family